MREAGNAESLIKSVGKKLKIKIMKRFRILVVLAVVLAVSSAFTSSKNVKGVLQYTAVGWVGGIMCADGLFIDNGWDCTTQAEGEVCTVTTLAGTVTAYEDYFGCEYELPYKILHRVQ